MTEPKRYAHVGHSEDDIKRDDENGEFVTFEDYEKRVESQLKLLEVAGRRIEDLENQIEFQKEMKITARVQRDKQTLTAQTLAEKLNDLQKDL